MLGQSGSNPRGSELMISQNPLCSSGWNFSRIKLFGSRHVPKKKPCWQLQYVESIWLARNEKPRGKAESTYQKCWGYQMPICGIQWSHKCAHLSSEKKFTKSAPPPSWRCQLNFDAALRYDHAVAACSLKDQSGNLLGLVSSWPSFLSANELYKVPLALFLDNSSDVFESLFIFIAKKYTS